MLSSLNWFILFYIKCMLFLTHYIEMCTYYVSIFQSFKLHMNFNCYNYKSSVHNTLQHFSVQLLTLEILDYQRHYWSHNWCSLTWRPIMGRFLHASCQHMSLHLFQNWGHICNIYLHKINVYSNWHCLWCLGIKAIVWFHVHYCIIAWHYNHSNALNSHW